MRMIGGEESGGYAFRGNVPERDGILAGLYMLDFMVQTGKKPTELLQMLFDKVGEHYYDRVDTPFSGDRKSREQIILNAEPENPWWFESHRARHRGWLPVQARRRWLAADPL